MNPITQVLTARQTFALVAREHNEAAAAGRPGVPIDPRSTAIHGLTTEAVARKRRFSRYPPAILSALMVPDPVFGLPHRQRRPAAAPRVRAAR